MGPFEEEEEGTGVASDVFKEGTGVASDVFKVEGEDPVTPGPLS